MEAFKDVSFEHLYNCLKLLSNANELKEKFIVGGGSVPYLLAHKSSTRLHGDIDIIANKKDMRLIRNYLKKNNLYDKQLDSLFFESNKNKTDYGIITNLNNLAVEFYPYEEIIDPKSKKQAIMIKTFGFEGPNGKPNYKQTCLADLSIKELTTKVTLNNQQTILTLCPEVLWVMKYSIGKNRLREKDTQDIQMLNNLPMNKDLLIKIHNAFHNKKTTRTIGMANEELVLPNSIIENKQL